MPHGDPATFWRWFQAAEARVREVEGPEKDAILDDLATAVADFDEAISFEIGVDPEGGYELILTADGNVDAFPTVEGLVAAAPAIPDWKVTAFKPPRGFEFRLAYEGVEVDPQQCRFMPMGAESDPKLFGVRIGFPGFNEEKSDIYQGLALLMLETGLGEVAAATRIQHLEVGEIPPGADEEEYIPVVALPAYLEWREKHV